MKYWLHTFDSILTAPGEIEIRFVPRSYDSKKYHRERDVYYIITISLISVSVLRGYFLNTDYHNIT